MILHIKNMQSSRCEKIVKDELNKLGLCCIDVELGKVELKDEISNEYLKELELTLKDIGFEILHNKEKLLIEEIKEAIEQLINLSNDTLKPNFSDYIGDKVKRNYSYLSNLFSGSEGTTIEKYIITRKIERAKEYLVYEDISLSDIAYRLQYSSVAHLSNQFKKVTGLTPSFFRQHRKIKQNK